MALKELYYNLWCLRVWLNVYVKIILDIAFLFSLNNLCFVQMLDVELNREPR